MEVIWPYEISESLSLPDYKHRPVRMVIACALTVDDSGVMVGIDLLLAYYLSYIRLVCAAAWIEHAARGLHWHFLHRGARLLRALGVAGFRKRGCSPPSP